MQADTHITDNRGEIALIVIGQDPAGKHLLDDDRTAKKRRNFHTDHRDDRQRVRSACVDHPKPIFARARR
ncbi:MAG: hypothetical protein ACLVJX_09310 [Merdibacter sp.]